MRDADRTRRCVVCDSDIPARAMKCTICQSLQIAKTCVVCALPIPYDARYCGNCWNYQSWRRHVSISQLTLSLVTSLFSVMTTLVAVAPYVFGRDSHTTLMVTTADGDSVHAWVSNTGKTRSMVGDCLLVFPSDINIQDAPCELRREDAIAGKGIIKPGDVLVAFKVRGLRTRYRKGRPNERYPVRQVRDSISTLPAPTARLRVRFQESNGDSPYRDSPDFPVDRLYELMDRKLLDTPRDSS
jgi:predicted nucleic acid-binding Zn ribbon protein